MKFNPPAAQVVFSLALTLAFLTLRTEAQSFKVVHNFSGRDDGANPLNGLMMTSTGVMYGTADAGGESDNGSVFTINPDGKLVLIHSFEGGQDGAHPQSFLVEDKAGNLYGTTSAGGAHGDGTVYRVSGSKETVLYSFGSQSHDGADPEAGLALDASGDLYGTTYSGGLSGHGTVFKLTPPAEGGEWAEKILHNFGSGTDGQKPVAGVTLDASGDLYGTTSTGGTHGYGTVYELVKANSWTETILHDFQNLADGATPYAGLILSSSGNLFGAATDGGTQGGGTVFELTRSGSKWNFSVIASVPGWGVSGTFRDLMFASPGTIYATTHCDGAHNAGTVYKLALVDGKWEYTLLYTFTGESDGKFVFSNLVLNNGKLYGTSNVGGTDQDGVIFKVTP